MSPLTQKIIDTTEDFESVYYPHFFNLPISLKIRWVIYSRSSRVLIVLIEPFEYLTFNGMLPMIKAYMLTKYQLKEIPLFND